MLEDLQEAWNNVEAAVFTIFLWLHWEDVGAIFPIQNTSC